MAESRHRWIDDVSDDYDSSEEEPETQPCSVSPMRRDSICQSPRASAPLAIDCLLKQVELMQAPYQFLLIGIPYKLNSCKKAMREVFGQEAVADVELKMLYRGKTFSGKAILKTNNKDVAKSFAHIHGRRAGNRELAVEVFRELPQKPPAHRRPISLKIAAPLDNERSETPQSKDEETKSCTTAESSSPHSHPVPSAPTTTRVPRFKGGNAFR